jgi:Protein of unknown function (DUF3306)
MKKGPKMSAHENFVSRWSRLKHESESRRNCKTELREHAAPASTAVTSSANKDEAAGTETRATPIFDPTGLPSIDSITARTDIGVFLRSGVPAEMTVAALRRAWVSDPVIRDFIGIAENQWDFTNPTTIPGFGPLPETGDEPSLIAQTVPTLDRSLDEFSARPSDTDASAEKTRSVTGGSRRDEIGDTVGEKQAASATRGVDSGTSNAAPESGCVKAAVQNNPFPGSTAPRRRHAHGGALPR